MTTASSAGSSSLPVSSSWIDDWVLEGAILRGSAYLSVGVGELLQAASDRQSANLCLHPEHWQRPAHLLHSLRPRMTFMATNAVQPRISRLLAPAASAAGRHHSSSWLKAPPRRAAGFACAFNLALFDRSDPGSILPQQGGYQYVMDYPLGEHARPAADSFSSRRRRHQPAARFPDLHRELRGRRDLARDCAPLGGILLLPAAHVARCHGRVYVSLDLFFFYIFHDFALIPTFLLIGIWGIAEPAVRLLPGHDLPDGRAASFCWRDWSLWSWRCRAPHRTFDIPTLQAYIAAHPLPHATQNIIFLLLTVGFGILVGLFPFHSWAPPGYASAPPAAAMLHAGILKKYALYGMIRITIPMLHDGFETSGSGSFSCSSQGTFSMPDSSPSRRRNCLPCSGFSSIMHMGYLFLGIACWNVIGVTGAVVLMVAHGLSAALLFGLSGEITHRSGENRFGTGRAGQVRAPVLAILFSFASMASMGVPGLANFAGELMVFFASFTAGQRACVFALIAIYGTVITAIFQLRAIKNFSMDPCRNASPADTPAPPRACTADRAFAGIARDCDERRVVPGRACAVCVAHPGLARVSASCLFCSSTSCSRR